MREQEERNDGLGRHGMKQKEENMGTEKGKKTQGHTKTHKHRHTETDTEDRDTGGTSRTRNQKEDKNKTD